MLESFCTCRFPGEVDENIMCPLAILAQVNLPQCLFPFRPASWVICMASAPALVSASQEVSIFAWEAESRSGWTSLALVLGVVYLLGFLSFPCVKACLCWCCCGSKALQSTNSPASSCIRSSDQSPSSSSPSLPQAAHLWQNLVVVGLRLVHKRHRVSTAFKALEAQASLRQAKGSRPSVARQKLLTQRTSRTSTPIKEGPAFKDGSDASGA